MTLKQSDLCFLAVPSNVSAIFHPQRLHSALCSAAQPKDGPGREPLVSKTSLKLFGQRLWISWRRSCRPETGPEDRKWEWLPRFLMQTISIFKRWKTKKKNKKVTWTIEPTWTSSYTHSCCSWLQVFLKTQTSMNTGSITRPKQQNLSLVVIKCKKKKLEWPKWQEGTGRGGGLRRNPWGAPHVKGLTEESNTDT